MEENVHQKLSCDRTLKLQNQKTQFLTPPYSSKTWRVNVSTNLQESIVNYRKIHVYQILALKVVNVCLWEDQISSQTIKIQDHLAFNAFVHPWEVVSAARSKSQIIVSQILVLMADHVKTHSSQLAKEAPKGKKTFSVYAVQDTKENFVKWQ